MMCNYENIYDKLASNNSDSLFQIMVRNMLVQLFYHKNESYLFKLYILCMRAYIYIYICST